MRLGVISLTCGLAVLTLAGQVHAAERALPPHAGGAVRALLGLSVPLPDGSDAGVQLSAKIDRDRIAVVGRDGQGVVRLSVTLVNADDAPPGATVLGGVALVPTPGPAPEALVGLLAERMRQKKVKLPWVTIEREPPPELEAQEITPIDWSQVDRGLMEGALRDVRVALAKLESPKDVMQLANLALRWRLAGAPARASALVEGRDKERSAYEVLALRFARGGTVSVRAALEALPEQAPCKATGLATLFRLEGDCERANVVAEAILKRNPECARAAYEAVVCYARRGQLVAAKAALTEAALTSPRSFDLLMAKSALLTRMGDHGAAWRVEVQIATRRLGERGVWGAARFLFAWCIDAFERRAEALVNALRTPTAPTASPGGAESRWCPEVANLSCLRLVPGGAFSMGAQASVENEPGYDSHAEPDEAPVRQVTISSLYAMETEVDVRSFTACVRAGACPVSDVEAIGGYFNYGQPLRADHPINGVSWAGASRYCEWIGGRLPTEAEWEFLARGSDGRRFPWGEATPECGAASSRSAHQGCPTDGTRPPGILVTSSAAGLTAMGSGVWEWVADWYGPYALGASQDPMGPQEGTDRVQRGGGWTTEDAMARRASARASMPPETRASDVGFRCVRSR